ncbi:EscE/YscE/SsaE family type III secretion system needle protein co-chaperone [Yersinia massiliensis]|uniref:EscE/YscE/SsaE family type III secretion system needle protein co-chaperone n=1 Tax=Yersinia massiliensis TaxID=419257 RepID=UPI00031D27B8|nr:EscE/YscE/SsaE family type III secretion system needle protein co-chaperone [Yersinia massiliensis]MCB5307067.1 EscE/YscE/SsaE family type III secretion system needle protein co-chaperone [Yersinia massiliensis]
MQHITVLEDDIKSKSKEIEKKKELLIKEQSMVINQLTLQQTPDNYKNLNEIILALRSAERIIDILTSRYSN